MTTQNDNTNERAATRIIIEPAKRRFGRRRQWRYTIVAPNGRKISDRDTYANPADIRSALKALVSGDNPVFAITRNQDAGTIRTDKLR